MFDLNFDKERSQSLKKICVIQSCYYNLKSYIVARKTFLFISIYPQHSDLFM